MTARLPFLVAACLVLAGSVVAQEYTPPDPQYPIPLFDKAKAKPDLATLVPAHTLAYLELHQPDRLAQEVRELLKGSQLQEPGRLVSQLRRSKEDTTALALSWNVFAPEVLNELGGYEGGLLALTGVSRDGTPQIVAVLKTGKGGMASLGMRCYLASHKDAEPVGQVKGINIYRVEGLTVEPLEKRRAGAKSSAPAKRLGGVFLAQVPEAIVAGSTRTAVADTLHRLRGKVRSPSLADNKAFQEAATLRTGPGLFAYADAPRLYRLVRTMKLPAVSDDILPPPPELSRQMDSAEEAEDRNTLRQLETLEGMLNPHGVRFVAGSWSLEDGEFRSRLEIRTRQGQTIPALDWLADRKLSDDLLQAVPADAFYVLAVPVSEPLGSLDVRKMIDRLCGPLYPEGLRGLEQKLKVNLGKEVLGRVRTLAVAGGLRPRGETDLDGKPVVLIEAAGEEAARELEKLWPRLYALGEKEAQPRQVRVREETIHCLASAEAEVSLGSLPPCYARCGKVLVLGWEARSVAAAVRAPREGRPLLNLPRARATAQEEKAGVFLLFSCRQMLRQLCSLIERGNPSEQAGLPYLRRMSRAMKDLPPTVFLVRHEGNSYRCEMRQGELPKAAAPVLNALVPLLREGVGFQTWTDGMTLPGMATGDLSQEELKLLRGSRRPIDRYDGEAEEEGVKMSDTIIRQPAPAEARQVAAAPAEKAGPKGKLPAVQLINTPKVKFKVRLKMGSRPEAMPVDVYISSDDGATWQLVEGNHQLTPLPEEDQDTIPPSKGSVTVKIPRAGVVYGFCIRKQGQAAPAPGTPPDLRVERDDGPPDVTRPKRQGSGDRP